MQSGSQKLGFDFLLSEKESDITRLLQKRCCERQVNVLSRNGKSCPKGKELPKLYTCLRVATSAKAGRLP